MTVMILIRGRKVVRTISSNKNDNLDDRDNQHNDSNVI